MMGQIRESKISNMMQSQVASTATPQAPRAGLGLLVGEAVSHRNFWPADEISKMRHGGRGGGDELTDGAMQSQARTP